MKLQYLAVIFVIIMIPLFMVLSTYMNTHIDTIDLQTYYTSVLNDATYDAVKAFQINTTNNYYSGVNDSKIRDIDASINSFFGSLTDNTDLLKQDLQAYVPAVVYTLYDGYYIYGKRYNVYDQPGKENGIISSISIDTQLADGNRYEYGIKPFVYYSCRYVNGNNKFVVNFTLDNFISIYGTIYVWNDDHTTCEKHYVTKSGYLIDYTAWDQENKTYKGAKIEEQEVLTEYLCFNQSTIIDDGMEHNETRYEKEDGIYQYVVHQNRKVYFKPGKAKEDCFWYENGKAVEVQRDTIKKFVAENTKSAVDYYQEAYAFSKWVSDNIGDITLKNARIVDSNGEEREAIKKVVDENGNEIETTILEADTGNQKLFNMKNQDPEDPSSPFNQHRMAVMKYTIETNLLTAINSYNNNASSYEYVLPRLQDEEWDKIINNVCVISFMQGIPIGEKYFNNYVVIPNDKNNEFVDEDSIYLIAEDGEYHLPTCQKLIEGKVSVENATGYKNTSFVRQTFEKRGVKNYYYYHNYEADGKNVPYTACYECIVNSGTQYEIEDVIKSNSIKGTNRTYDITDLRSKYLTALAREKQELYKSVNMNSRK